MRKAASEISVLLLLAILLFTTQFDSASAQQSEKDKQLQRFQELAKNLKYVSDNVAVKHPSGHNLEATAQLHDLVRGANLLPANLLESESPRERSLACLVFSLSERTDVIPLIAKLRSDRTPGMPEFSSGPPPSPENFERQTVYRVYKWANTALNRSLSTSFSAREQLKNDYFVNWWRSVRNPHLLPSVWKLKYFRTIEWKESFDTLRQELLKQPTPHKQILALALLNYHGTLKELSSSFDSPLLLSEDEVLKLFEELDGETRRQLAAGTYDLGYGDNTIHTMNQLVPLRVQEFILFRHPDKLLNADDRKWLLQQAECYAGEANEAQLFLALSKLDPKSALPAHARWLQRFIESRLAREITERKDFGDEAALLEEDIELWAEKVLELLTLYGPPAVPYVAEFFYGRGWKLPASQDHLGYLLMFQKQLVEQLAAKHAKLARPVLRAVIADAKFLELGWSSTRAIAEVADAHVLRPERKEPDAHPAVADVLKLQHALDAEAFDLATAAAAGKPPPDGEAVLKAVREFQAFLRTWTRQHP